MKKNDTIIILGKIYEPIRRKAEPDMRSGYTYPGWGGNYLCGTDGYCTCVDGRGVPKLKEVTVKQ